MRITSDEHALAVAALPFLGTAFGWWLSQRTAKSSAREQRRLEGDRRADDRRAALYEDVLRAMADLLRHVNGTSKPGEFEASFADMVTTWTTRLELFASPDVAEEFRLWVLAFVQFMGTKVRQPANENEKVKWREWEQEMQSAAKRVRERMRRDLDSWRS